MRSDVRTVTTSKPPAVILAAGRGTRLGALTADRPKPLLTVRGRPLLEWILLGLRAAGIERALCVVGYRGDQIRDYFGDGSRVDMRLSYVSQTAPHGTGAALRLGRAFAEEGPVLMSFGDILTDHDHYRSLLADFRADPCGAVMGINEMADVSAGAAVVRAGRHVTGIVEKPDPALGLGNWNQAGVTAFGAPIWPFLEGLTESSRGELEITEAVAMLIGAGHEVRAVEFGGFWSDVGTPEALREAERLWKSPLEDAPPPHVAL